MKQVIINLLLLWILNFVSKILSCQQIIGGAITYQQIDNNMVEFHVTTYTLDMPYYSYVMLNYGDGGVSIIHLTSTRLYNVYQNSGSAIHVFPFGGVFRVSAEGSTLIESVINITNSGDEELYLETKFNLVDPQVYGFNTSPVYLNPQYLFEFSDDCVLLHNENAYDPDGDSLVFEMIPFPGTESTFPEATDFISINPATGDFIWQSPTSPGLYGLAFTTSEYRGGIFLGSTMRSLIIDSECFVSEEQLEVYPSPSSSQITIQTNDQITSVAIFDIVGQLVSTHAVAGNSLIQVEISNLSSGMYVVRATGNNLLTSKTFVKI